jgi:hypothetical protein
LLARLSVALFAVAALGAAACSDDSNGLTTTAPSQAKGTVATGGTDTSNAPPPPVSTGVVASVKVEPSLPTVQVGWYLDMIATAYDANGVRVTGKVATWRVADANILTLSDTGSARAIATGVTKIYGTIDGHTDSATVTVIPAVIGAPPVTTPPPSSPAVASFDLTVKVSGAVVGADTSKVERVAGATVILTRVGGTHGDTLSLSVPAGSAVTDANGVATFTALDGGAYTVNITPPAGSTYESLGGGFGPPSMKNASVAFTLHHKS